mmetsp:Transcript_20381/g.44561  ORF Transcript_20381/g.44561 Transcript_20381/m.44561 type:complete len:468 (-) Transcript_20381:206-1609(-)|eukprot:CAMPEP_0202907092 /NCGR_PEP_ID=MMETSP1392-20130828/41277_1 /ASSEMBLY_ACC=CAM_ASM_000868 /TAXON_ID=225041 /ORGANISM="Chlamydomonas chlamydogama, Strain SAG 11-48b" /LENGTH=467 /DNA_ID=CAMNT_0049595843 /DNA_START=20 /DNA_END=1423 /DNA_ORIENTATION=+
MAWGKGPAAGVDDLCKRLESNDAKLTSLTILKHRKFDAAEAGKLCKSLAANTVLTELYASSHALSPDSVKEFASLLSSNSTLRSLCIGDSNLGDAGLTQLSQGLGVTCSLQTLDLEHKGITGKGMPPLSDALQHNTALSSLSLSRNPLGNDGISALAASGSSWLSLKTLDLSSCEAGPQGVASLASSTGPCCLVSLNLRGNSLGPEAGPHLAALLTRNTGLTELQLQGCELGDQGVRALAQGLPGHSCIRILELSKCGAGEQAGFALAEALHSNTSLRHLNLAGSRDLSPAAVQRLAEAVTAQHEEGARAQGAAHAQPLGLTHLDVSEAKLHGEAGISALSALLIAPLHSLCLLGCVGLGDAGAVRLAELLRRAPDAGSGAGGVWLRELSVSGCSMSLSGGLAHVFAALQDEQTAASLQVLECGANPACKEDGMEDAVRQLRETRPDLHVHWNVADDGQEGPGRGPM